MTEDKYGRIGIGTAAPASKLTVQGMIETTLGGYKFPDVTIQTSAASSLATTVPLILSGDVAGPVLKATNVTGIGAEITGGVGGSIGAVAQGGLNLGNPGASGISASGGGALGSSNGGIGVLAQGGTSELQTGGVGIFLFRRQRKDVTPALTDWQDTLQEMFRSQAISRKAAAHSR